MTDLDIVRLRRNDIIYDNDDNYYRVEKRYSSSDGCLFVHYLQLTDSGLLVSVPNSSHGLTTLDLHQRYYVL